ncbi:MAG: N(4)-(beta-N-acetylglucosaminyl)-L-asparaginase [Planctomycetota bacterium]|jgi:N4-(beta-N-acetylglucosaminyl)-L-asparaginase
MSNHVSRRGFLQVAAASAAGLSSRITRGDDVPNGSGKTVVVASGNGLPATAKAAEMIERGEDTLDAVVAGVNIVERDPSDASVGYGGLPNERCVVELDSCVMHGPTANAGAVAALQRIKTPSSIAKLVMERTDHVMLIGYGALEFARAHGFEEVNLLTERARKAWLKWKENLSDKDDWLPPPEVPDGDKRSSAELPYPFTYGTINCCAVNSGGDLSGVTTTSGLSYKLPGRVGDSPIIGAGLFVDNGVGAAGSTGRGEAVIKICGAHTVVEEMRHGKSPQEACLAALQRIADKTTAAHLLRRDGRPNFDVKFYAVAKDGRHGAAAIWSGANYAVYSEGRNRKEDCAYLFKRDK